MGSPVDQILYTSEEIGAGLVVGRRGLGGVKRLLMGSVSEGLVHHARCPVLVLRGGQEAWPPSRVLMADDGSDDSKKAAQLAASIENLFGASGSLVQVYLEKAEAQLQNRADDLERWLGSRPEVKLVGDESDEGIISIARTILGEAREADAVTLISVGSRGFGRISRVRIGSVSTKVVRAAEAPVLVYPHPRDA
jgi:nucleotide-binding universal stress UspA family protein